MAGIGFQLKRIISKGGLASSIQAVISGVFIVAGPWLISVSAMAVMQILFLSVRIERTDVFQSVVIYVYAASLSLFAGVHHLYTRIIADLAWVHKEGEASAWLLRFIAATAFAAVLIAAPAVAFLPIAPELRPGAIKAAIIFLFAVLNVLWICLLHASQLKSYRLILSIFLAGMTVSIVGTLAMGAVWGPAGAVTGYALGIAAIAGGLSTAIFQQHPVRASGLDKATPLRYARRYWKLAGSGLCFYAGQWLDKAYFWMFRGQEVPGTPFHINAPYDYAVYLAGLSIIPGLVYFITIAETRLEMDVQRFILALNRRSWKRIEESKRRLAVGITRELRDQSTFQLAFSLALAGVLTLAKPPGIPNEVLWLALLASLLQFIVLDILIYLYYFELYSEALATSVVYAFINGPMGFAAYSLFPGLPAGLGHAAASAMAGLVGIGLLFRAIRRMEHIIFLRTLGVA